MLMDKQQKKQSLIKIYFRFLRKTAKACPVYFCFTSLAAILLGIFLALNTVALDGIFQAVAVYIKGDMAFAGVLKELLFLLLCILANPVLNGIYSVASSDFEQKAAGIFKKEFHQKCAKIDPVEFDKTEFLDDVEKAEKGILNSIRFVNRGMIAVVIYLPYFIIIGSFLYRLKPILLAVLFIIFLPTLLSQLLKGRLFTGFEDQAAPLRREYSYYETCITDRIYFKETRQLGGFSFFKNLYMETLGLLNREIYLARKKAVIMALLLKSITLAGYLLILGLLAAYVIDGSITVGSFGAVLASLDLFIEMMKELICYVIGRMMENTGTVCNLVNFLDYEEREGTDNPLHRTEGHENAPQILLENVSFTYPERDQAAVRQVSFRIESGETVAVVGENGAGKSSLLRLLTGIYRPNLGTITLGGLDTKCTAPQKLYQNSSGVFQKFQRYKITAAENISISDTSCMEEGRAARAALSADLQLEGKSFPDGPKTMLSREFDGVDLSGGEWQRIAIARGFYKEHSLIFLDEPTAAIDPLEETKLYHKFREMAEGKTAVIVTHRMGAAKIADRIIVMEEGTVVQMGTHEELMQKDGKYKTMYLAQGQWYD